MKNMAQTNIIYVRAIGPLIVPILKEGTIMKKFLALLLAIMMLLGCVAMAEEAPAGLTQNIVVLFTSDAHAGIDQGWGYAGVAAIRDAMARLLQLIKAPSPMLVTLSGIVTPVRLLQYPKV